MSALIIETGDLVTDLANTGLSGNPIFDNVSDQDASQKERGPFATKVNVLVFRAESICYGRQMRSALKQFKIEL